jgi:prepilin-type N-terminal cleavage/methylation domain-containing protein
MLERIATILRMPRTSGAATAPAGAPHPAGTYGPQLQCSGRCSRLRGRLAAEDGFTLIEVLMVAALLAVVVTATLTPFEFAQTQTPKDVEYAKAITDASTGLQRMMSDIRQAYRIEATTPNSIEFNAVENSSDLQLLYECDEPYPSATGNTHYKEYRRCLRVSAPTGTTLPSIATGSVVVDRLLNATSAAPVFTFKDASGNADPTNPTYVEANVQLPARGALNSGLNHTIELHNGTILPNLVLTK